MTIITFIGKDGKVDHDKIEAFQYNMIIRGLETEIRTGMKMTSYNFALWRGRELLEKYGIKPKRTKKAVLKQLLDNFEVVEQPDN
tara:strand:+ start:398 stop:652 length:255 start_codon:yes stop_codon:yes gene_type:complete